MPDPRDSVELTVGGQPQRSEGPERADVPRPWLGLYFRCAGAYGRAYRNAAGTSYSGRCPKCGKTVRFGVGAGGTSNRMFEVGC